MKCNTQKLESSVILYAQTYDIRQNGILRNWNPMHPTVRPKLLYTTEWNIQKSESKASRSTPKLAIHDKMEYSEIGT